MKDTTTVERFQVFDFDAPWTFQARPWVPYLRIPHRDGHGDHLPKLRNLLSS